MATIAIGKIKQVWRNTWANNQNYAVDDLVAHTDQSITSTYIAVQASTSGSPQAPSTGGTVNTSYWNLVSKGGADGASAGIESQNVYTSTGTSTWTKPSGVTKIKVIVTGGGGGASAVGGNRLDDVGAGGASGGTSIKVIDVSSISSVTVTVGSGGAAAAANAADNNQSTTGTNGGTSSFGSHCSATGGQGGKSYYDGNSIGHATPGVGSGGDINLQGGHGALPILNYNGAPHALSGGVGGSSFWGGCSRGALDDDFTNGSNDISGGASSGSSGGAYGSGGYAGSREFTGGAGAHGVVVVENYK